MNIGPVGAELFHAEGGTGRHEDANSPLSQFCEHAYKDKEMHVLTRHHTMNIIVE
jgi:hypothetical protein